MNVARLAASSLEMSSPSRLWYVVRPHALAIAVLMGVIALSVSIVLLPIDYSAMGNYGYLGVFFVTLLATAAIVLPVPYLGIIVVAGSFLDPVLIGLIAGLAAAIGEFTGYVLGRSGRALMPESRWYRAIEQAMARFGTGVIFIGAALPNPFFDAIGVVAGATRMPIWKFAAPCFVGKALRFGLLAALGGSLPFL